MNQTKSNINVTVLVQGLQRLARTAGVARRYPALETLLCRGSHFEKESTSPDHFRLTLFGIDTADELPIAALTRAADRRANPGKHRYWLRLDPVTLMADMARVIMTGHGFADLDESERNEFENVVRSVLRDADIVLQSDHPERWCIALDEPLKFTLTPLAEALGMDMAEALPERPESLRWRRIMNEIEIELHASSVNLRRRQNGQQAINSVWFWGGGYIPSAGKQGVFDTVYSDHPVTCGLAVISDCRLGKQSRAEQVEFSRDGPSVLVDWTVRLHDPERELDRLEHFVKRLLGQVRSGSIELVVYRGGGEGWRFGRRSERKFWRHRRPLGEICFSGLPA